MRRLQIEWMAPGSDVVTDVYIASKLGDVCHCNKKDGITIKIQKEGVWINSDVTFEDFDGNVLYTLTVNPNEPPVPVIPGDLMKLALPNANWIL